LSHALTGSPIPLWYIETLDHPRLVASVTEQALVLEDGTRLELPHIRALSVGHPVFDDALQYGVEVREDGEVLGLLRVQKICGNDPVMYRRVRVNLSDLAGVLNPAGIDPKAVHPDYTEYQTRNSVGNDGLVRVDVFLLLDMKSLRREINRTVGIPESDDYAPVGRSGEHDLRSGGLLL